MVDQLSSFADEVTRVAREVGSEGKLGGQAQVRGVAGTWRDLTDNVNYMASNLTGPGPQHRLGDHGRRQGRPVAEDHGRRPRRDPRAQGHRQHDGRPAVVVRHRGHPGRPRGRHRGQARRSGRGQGRLGYVARPHRQRQPARLHADHPAARDRRGVHRGDPRRPDPEHRGRGAGRGRRAQGQHQPDDRHAPRDHQGERGAGLARLQPGPDRRPAAGPARPRRGLPHDHDRGDAAGGRPARRVLPGRQRGSGDAAAAGRRRTATSPATTR